jgi:hypothetical protein
MKSFIADLILGVLIFEREQWMKSEKGRKREFELDRKSVWVSTEKVQEKCISVSEESFMPTRMGVTCKGEEMMLCRIANSLDTKPILSLGLNERVT